MLLTMCHGVCKSRNCFVVVSGSSQRLYLARITSYKIDNWLARPKSLLTSGGIGKGEAVPRCTILNCIREHTISFMPFCL
jgi:hypothetical protein